MNNKKKKDYKIKRGYAESYNIDNKIIYEW